ncbi:MAG: glycosyltransferase [Pseudomonadota bacterium]
MPDLFVTNFNKNFTGVSATATNVVRAQTDQFDLRLVGQPLPGCPGPISVAQARAASRRPASRPFAIWHVRRNTEMRAAIWARDVLRLPIKTVFTSAAQRRHSAYPRWLISRMDAIIATTSEAAAYVDNVWDVVPHGVDTGVFFPAPDPALDWASLGYGGSRGVATIGRVRPEKGTDQFIAAMIALMQAGDTQTTALVIGKASAEHSGFQKSLIEQVHQAGLAERILFPGEKSAEQLPQLMRSLSCVVQMPRYEGYGMVPLEAMASGVPFIATDAGFFREFSCQSQTGSIVATPAGAAAALAALLADDAQHAAMRRTCRHQAELNFSVAAEAAGINAVYERMWSGAV